MAHIAVMEPYLTSTRALQTAHDPEQRAFAAAVAPQHDRQAAGMKGQTVDGDGGFLQLIDLTKNGVEGIGVNGAEELSVSDGGDLFEGGLIDFHLDVAVDDSSEHVGNRDGCVAA
mgnify:CR=1 FL=1